MTSDLPAGAAWRRVARLRCAVLVALLCGMASGAAAAGAGAAGAGYANERRAVIDRLADSAEARQLNGIGQVTAAGPDGHIAWYGTAFVVSPCLVLTNFHVAYGLQGKPAVPPALHFRYGQTGDRQHPFRYSTAAVAIAAGDYVAYDIWPESDWALLQLKARVPATIVPIPVVPTPRDALSGIPLATAGFPADLAYPENWVNLYGDLNCSAFKTSSDPDVIVSDCMSNHGDSGSPILRRTSEGTFVAVGLISTGIRTDLLSRMIGVDAVAARFPDLESVEFTNLVRKAFDGAAPATNNALPRSDDTLAKSSDGYQSWGTEVGLFSAPTLPEDYFAAALDAHADPARIAQHAARIPVGERIRRLIDATACTP